MYITILSEQGDTMHSATARRGLDHPLRAVAIHALKSQF